MRIKSIDIYSLHIPFKIAFKHASAERRETQTIWVEIQTLDGLSGYGEGCPRDYVTAENLETAKFFFENHAAQWTTSLKSCEDLRAWVNAHEGEIDQHPAAWCAVEMAFLDLFAQYQHQSVEALLNLPPVDGHYQYTAVLGDAEPEQFAAQLSLYIQRGFSSFKIKLSGIPEKDRAKVELFKAAGIAPAKVRADANNLWHDPAVAKAFLRALDYPFVAIEEPLTAGDWAGLSYLAGELNTRIILDESFISRHQLHFLDDNPTDWIVNLRISKMGGVLRSLEIAHRLTQTGHGLILGAHVGETSLLTRAALTLAQKHKAEIIAQEGAFSTHLLSRDITDTPLTFGVGGVLDVCERHFPSRSGWGLVMAPDILWKQKLFRRIN